MKLYSYIVVKDHGFAPNPFFGYCTLAVCTPNHRGIKPQKDDWVIGVSTKARGNSLVYAMQVNETLHFDDYFKDLRFQEKKPDLKGTWQKRCGDNFYEVDSSGQWVQYDNVFHKGKEYLIKDTKYPYVFIATHFYYFGDQSITILEEFRSLIFDQRGIKFNFDPKIVKGFLAWLEKTCNPGIHGNPKDIEVECKEDCS